MSFQHPASSLQDLSGNDVMHPNRDPTIDCKKGSDK